MTLSPLTRCQYLFSQFPQTLSFCSFYPFSTPALYILSCAFTPNASPSHTRSGMHCYSYDGCDSDSPASDPLSGSDSEASNIQPQRSLVILLDDDDDDEEVEQPVHPLPSHRPKRPLPRNFSRSYHSPVKGESAQGTEVYHTISCTPALRDKSLEVRLFLSIAISHPELCRRNSGWNVIARARLPRGSLPSRLAAG